MTDADESVSIIAEGEQAVITFLEEAGVPEFAIDTYLEGTKAAPRMGWPWGAWVEEASDDDRVATVTRRADGIYRVESGPAQEFEDFVSGCDDDDGDMA
jgi:hypothetical protein